MVSVLLHDERVDGGTPQWEGTVGFLVNKDDSLQRILSWVTHIHRMHGPIEVLSIIGHGYADRVFHVGGHGIQFGKDNILPSNVHEFAAIKGKAKRIILMSCGAAAVNIMPPASDGRQLCRRLAAATGTGVMAPVQLQYYRTVFYRMKPGRIESTQTDRGGEIDLGNWEGPVYLFMPDGTTVNATPWAGAT